MERYIKSDAQLQIERELAEELKLKINNMVWMYAGENTLLKDAEEMACRFFNDIWKSRGSGSID